MDKPRPSDFMKSGSKSLRPSTLPTMVFTTLAKSALPAAKTMGASHIAYSVDSLEKLASAFEQKERSLGKR